MNYTDALCSVRESPCELLILHRVEHIVSRAFYSVLLTLSKIKHFYNTWSK